MSKLPPALSVSYVNTKKDDGPQGSGGPPPKPLRWQMPISDRGENEAVWTNIREAFDPNLGYHSGPEKTSKSDLLARWVTHRSDRGENWAVRRNIRKAFDRYHSGPEKTSRGGLFGRWVMYISDRGEKWAVRTNIRNAFHSEFSYHSTESLSDIYDAEFKNQTANVIARHESDLLAKATTICTTSPFKPLALACYERTLENKIFTDPAAPKPAHDEDLTDARVRHGRLLVHVGERARQPGDAYRQAPDGKSSPMNHPWPLEQHILSYSPRKQVVQGPCPASSTRCDSSTTKNIEGIGTRFLLGRSSPSYSCWVIWPALVVLWGVCWMFTRQQHGGTDMSISLLAQQGQQVDIEVPLNSPPTPTALDNAPWYEGWNHASGGQTTLKTPPPRPSSPGNPVLQSYNPKLHAQGDWAAEWNGGLGSFDMDAINFPTPGWPNDGSPGLGGVGGDVREPLIQEGDPGAQHPRSGTPAATSTMPNVLHPAFSFLTEHSLALPTAATFLEVALPPPLLAQESSPNQLPHAHNSLSALPPFSAGNPPHLPRTGSNTISYEPNRGPSAQAHQLLPAKSTSFQCQTCEAYFVRKETLDRHMREQKHGAAYAGPPNLEEHLCPTPGCRKSVRGKGFKRPEKVKEHLTKKSCKPTKALSKARLRLAPTAPTAPPFPSPPQNLEVSHADVSETPPDNVGSAELEETLEEITCAAGSDKGNPTIAERVAFLQRCRTADEEELRTLEQEIHAKERMCQQIRERIAASQSNLDMLMGQHRVAPGM